MSFGYRPLHRRVPRPRTVRHVLTWSIVAALAVGGVSVFHQTTPLQPVDYNGQAHSAGSGPGVKSNSGLTGYHWINVKAGGDHASGSAISTLAGATFGAFAAANNDTDFTSAPTGNPVGWCTTDAAGTCYIRVPAASNGYVTRPIDAPAGFEEMTGNDGRLGLSTNYTTVTHTRHYQYRTNGTTGTLATVPNSTAQTANSGSSLGASASEYVVPRVNPVLDPSCGLNVGMLVDLSESVSGVNNADSLIRGALNAFRNSLTGTDSNLAIHTFGTDSPASGTGNTNLGLTPVGSSTLTSKINAITASTPGTEYTNWDEGMRSFQNTSGLDVVIVLTDGLPTAYDNNTTLATRMVELQHAIAASNTIKANGVRVVSVGIGGATAAAAGAYNLAKISGPVGNSDYFQLSNGYSELEAALKEMASKACEGTVSVTKRVIPKGQTGVNNAVATGGWTMTATASTNILRLDGTNNAWSNNVVGVTGANTGAVGFRLDFSTAGAKTVTITETQQAGHTLVTQNSRNARCWTAATPNTNLPITDAGALGFQVTVNSGDQVLCEVINQALDLDASLKVDKVWDIRLDTNGDGIPETFTSPQAAGLPTTASLNISGATGAPGTATFGTTYTGMSKNSVATIAETVNDLPPLCTNMATFATSTGQPAHLAGTGSSRDFTMANNTNQVTITNTVTCESKLTLVKEVHAPQGQSGPPISAWTLGANPTAGASLAGPLGTSGTPAATAAVTAGKNYALAETATTPAAQAYVQDFNPTNATAWNANRSAPGLATGSWVCVAATSVNGGVPTFGTTPITSGANGGVSVGAGQWVQCTAHNRPKPTIELVKGIDNGSGATAWAPASALANLWNLSADWTAPATGTAGGSLPDGVTSPYGTQATVSANGTVTPTPVLPGTYDLSESAAQTGFDNAANWSCVVNGGQPQTVPAGDTNLALKAGDTARCTIVNVAKTVDPTVAKTVSDITQLPSGQWAIRYTLSVTQPAAGSAENPAGRSGTYTLRDDLGFGPGVTIDNARWANGAVNSFAPASFANAASPDANGVFPIASNTAIGAGVTQVYSVLVIASLPAARTSPAIWNCGDSDSAFRNVAELVKSGTVISRDTACAAPAQPTITKMAGTPVPNADGTTSVSYAVTVTAPTGGYTGPLYYQVNETLPTLPTGVTMAGGWDVDKPESFPPLNGAGAGTSLTFPLPAEAGELSPGESHVYTITGTVRIAANAALATGSVDGCTITTGPRLDLLNTVELREGTSGPRIGTAQACAQVQAGGVEVDKTATSTTFDGTAWTVKYDVKVDNVTSNGSVYTLVDDLQFAAGTAVQSVEWTGPTSGTWPVNATGHTLATNAYLAPGGTHTYSVTVVVKTTADYPTGAAGQCTGQGPTERAFTNKATTTSPGGTDTDDACAEPTLPEITKEATGSTYDTATDVWTVSYQLTVDNNPGHATVYDLADAPAYPSGVTIVGGTVTDTTGASTDVTGEWNAATGGTILTNVAIDEDTTHTYLVQVRVRVTGTVANGNLTCEPQGPGNGFYNGATLTVGGVATDDADCWPIQPPVNPTVAKDVAGISQLEDGSWAVRYQLTVTQPAQGAANPNGVAGSYSLRDDIQFAPGIALDGAFWSDNTETTFLGTDYDQAVTPAGTGSWTLADNASIPAGVTHTYTVLALASLPGRPGRDADEIWTCDGADTAFFNKAELFRGQTVLDSDDACAEPATPTVAKSANETKYFTDGTAEVSYNVVVTAPTGDYTGPLFYQVGEALPQLPTGVELVDGWNIDGPGTDPAAEVNGDVTLPGPETAGSVTQGSPDTYTVTGKIRVDADADLAPLRGCSPLAGPHLDLLNKVTLLEGIDGPVVDSDDACAQVEVGGVDVTKTAKGITFDGTAYTVTYEVEVENITARGAHYDLTDTLRFVAGTDVQSIAWTVPGGAAGLPAWPAGDANHQLADNAYLMAGGKHTYTVTVVVETTDEFPTGPTTRCEGGEAPVDRAFTNQATTVSPTGTVTDRACEEPALPGFAKDAIGSTYDAATDSWTVSYQLTVDNTDGHDTVYDLADSPAYPAGVTILGGTVTDTTDGGDTDVTGGWVPGDMSPILTDVAIDAGDAHTYLVEIQVRITGAVAPGHLACNPDGQPGEGYYNAATLSVGNTDVTAEDCTPITAPVTPTPTKTVTSVQAGEEPGTWQITYDVVVTQPEEGPGNPDGLSGSYSLADTLRFGDGITVIDASWSGETSGDFAGDTATFATDRVIAAGDTHTYTVTVLAEVAPAAFEAEDGPTPATCLDGDMPAAGGFLNTAKLIALGDSTEVSDCAQPSMATVEKSATSVALDADSQSWTITWDVTVSNAAAPGSPAAPYVLTDSPDTMPAGLALDGEWKVTSDDVTINGTDAWADGDTTPWIVHTGRVAAGSSHTFTVSGVVQLVDPTLVPQPSTCRGAEPGQVLVNNAEVAWGKVSDDDGACTTVNYDDVSIDKTNGLPEGTTSVAPGTEFDYLLQVTNHGTRAATDIEVTDEVPSRLEVLSATGDGWTVDVDGNTVTAARAALAPGLGSTITVRVRVLPLADAVVIGDLDNQDSALEATQLLNEACVEAAADDNLANNCDTDELETRDIQAQAQAQCQAGGVPALSFRLLTTPNLANLPVTMAWSPIDGDGNPVAGAPEANLPDTITPGQIYNLTWPGVVLSDLGALIGLPGFRPQALSDFDADGNLLPGLAQWNGLVLDTTTATYPWRNNSRLTFSVNPEVSLELAYPDTEESPCAAAEAAGETSVEIEKTASAGNLKPGESFEYTLDVTNTHETGAADDVVVTDEIPASIKVNSIDKGSQTALPRWETCEITGKDARGFGGTLTCTLQGVVQPQSQASGSTAPPITLAVTLDNKATAEVTNTGVVNYCAAENAEACGTDEDDAFVVVDDLGGVDESDDDGGDTGGESGDVDGLPSTGSSVDPRTLGLAGLLIALGMSMLVGSRRRRES